MSQLISIGSSVFAGLTGVPSIHIHTDVTDHAAYDVCSTIPHLVLLAVAV